MSKSTGTQWKKTEWTVVISNKKILVTNTGYEDYIEMQGLDFNKQLLAIT